MNILFTTSAAPDKSPFSTKEKRPPLGLGSVMAVARNAGHNIFFIDNYLKPTNFIEEGFLQKNKIDFIGIYANTICYRDTLRMFSLIENLRQKGKWQGKIIVGGPHTSAAPQTIPDFVDFIVQGEGEKAILKILNSEIKNRTVREQRILNLDELPFEPWDIFSQLPYNYTCRWLNEKPIFTMNTSRGCPFKCTFCSVGSIWGRGYTFMSADRILAEIEYLIKKYHAKGIYFREDNFTLNLKRTQEFCEKLKQKNWQIAWACETRVSNLSENLIKLMSQAGCRAFYLGVESGSQKNLDFLKKGITLAQIENVINWSKKYNIRTYCSLITGIPGEIYADYLATKKLMERLKPYTYGFNIFVGIPSGELYDYVIKNKLYEYIDDLGLVYLPGFDIKCKFFYGRSAKYYVDYKFKKNKYTNYDHALLKELRKRLPKKILKQIKSLIGKFLPKFIKEKIKAIRIIRITSK